MFQLWKVVLLCALLTGTSASLLGNLGNDLKNVINEGHEIVEDTVQTVAGNLKHDLDSLQNSKLGQLTEQVLQKAEDLLAGAVSKVLSVKKDILGLKLSNVQLLDVKPKLTFDGHGLNVSISISADVELALPVIGTTADLKLSVDLLNGVSIETQNGKSKVAVSQCISDPASISLSLLDRQSRVVNRLTDAVSSFLSETLSALVEKQVCPLVRLFVSSLGVDYIQNTIDTLVKEVPLLKQFA